MGPGGREIYFVSPDRKLMAASVKPGTDSVESSAPQVLFPLPGVTWAQLHMKPPPMARSSSILAAPSQAMPLLLDRNFPLYLKETHPHRKPTSPHDAGDRP